MFNKSVDKKQNNECKQNAPSNFNNFSKCIKKSYIFLQGLVIIGNKPFDIYNS